MASAGGTANLLLTATVVDFAQHSVRIGKGNPVDGQLAPYLAEADVFATNDRRLARIIEAIRPSSPSPCAIGVFVDIKGAGGSVLDAFREASRAV